MEGLVILLLIALQLQDAILHCPELNFVGFSGVIFTMPKQYHCLSSSHQFSTLWIITDSYFPSKSSKSPGVFFKSMSHQLSGDSQTFHIVNLEEPDSKGFCAVINQYF